MRGVVALLFGALACNAGVSWNVPAPAPTAPGACNTTITVRFEGGRTPLPADGTVSCTNGATGRTATRTIPAQSLKVDCKWALVTACEDVSLSLCASNSDEVAIPAGPPSARNVVAATVCPGP
jgi:hypothetical protein